MRYVFKFALNETVKRREINKRKELLWFENENVILGNKSNAKNLILYKERVLTTTRKLKIFLSLDEPEVFK